MQMRRGGYQAACFKYQVVAEVRIHVWLQTQLATDSAKASLLWFSAKSTPSCLIMTTSNCLAISHFHPSDDTMEAVSYHLLLRPASELQFFKGHCNFCKLWHKWLSSWLLISFWLEVNEINPETLQHTCHGHCNWSPPNASTLARSQGPGHSTDMTCCLPADWAPKAPKRVHYDTLNQARAWLRLATGLWLSPVTWASLPQPQFHAMKTLTTRSISAKPGFSISELVDGELA